MLVHHGLGLPAEWFEEGLGYGQTMIGSKMLYEWIGNPTKICVSVFAVLTGYSYFYHNTPTLRYGIRKSVQLLLQYWFILFFVFYPLGYAISGHVPQGKEIIFNLFSVHNRAVSFSWYVLFYVLCMCTLPILMRTLTKYKVCNFLLLPVLFTVILNVLNHVQMKRWYLLADIRDYYYWMPVVWVGILIAKYDLFRSLQEKLAGMPRAVYGVLLILVPVLRGVWPEFACMNLDVIYGPVFVFTAWMLLQEGTAFFKVLQWIGRYSMYIWFVHALFFWDKTRKIFQPLAYRVNIPIVTLGIILIISLLFAIVLQWIWHGFGKMIYKCKEIIQKTV